MPVGFKWFVPGLIDGSFGVRRRGVRGRVVPAHATAPPGPPTRTASCSALLASEILAVDRADARASTTPTWSRSTATRRTPASTPRPTASRRPSSAALSPDDVTATELAGEPITAKLTEAPGNGAKIGGLKVTTESAWFAARPSGTEDVYKIYAESFQGPEHLAQVQAEAREVVSAALGG